MSVAPFITSMSDLRSFLISRGIEIDVIDHMENEKVIIRDAIVTFNSDNYSSCAQARSITFSRSIHRPCVRTVNPTVHAHGR